MRLVAQKCAINTPIGLFRQGPRPRSNRSNPRSRRRIGVTTGAPRAGGVALAFMRGEMPAAHSTRLENCRFPHMASLNEDDGWFRRSLKPSIVSRLRGCYSLLEGEPPVEPLHGMFLGGRLAIDRS